MNKFIEGNGKLMCQRPKNYIFLICCQFNQKFKALDHFWLRIQQNIWNYQVIIIKGVCFFHPCKKIKNVQMNSDPFYPMCLANFMFGLFQGVLIKKIRCWKQLTDWAYQYYLKLLLNNDEDKLITACRQEILIWKINSYFFKHIQYCVTPFVLFDYSKFYFKDLLVDQFQLLKKLFNVPKFLPSLIRRNKLVRNLQEINFIIQSIDSNPIQKYFLNRKKSK